MHTCQAVHEGESGQLNNFSTVVNNLLHSGETVKIHIIILDEEVRLIYYMSIWLHKILSGQMERWSSTLAAMDM